VKEEVAKANGRAFRVGGDEISGWLHRDQATNVMKAIDDRLRNSVITVEIDGTPRQMKGLTASYGTSTDPKLADRALYDNKGARLALGERAAPGALLGSISKVAQGPQGQTNIDLGTPEHLGALQRQTDALRLIQTKALKELPSKCQRVWIC
jgi:hypothetical protein